MADSTNVKGFTVANGEAWNRCPSCDEIVDVDEDAQPGAEVECRDCGAELVAECYGDSDACEWHLILASEYFTDRAAGVDD